MKNKIVKLIGIFSLLVPFFFTACARVTQQSYHDPNMDFGVVRTIAVMPFLNLTRDNFAAERVRDIFINRLLSTGAVYVLPMGEVARGITRLEILNPATPSPEECKKLGELLHAEAAITGVVTEYGEVRSGTTAATVISITLQMIETQTGKVVWTASSTKGGVDFWDRLLGGGGEPMNEVTVQAVNDVINTLFR
jgi:hypothetical protein